VFIVCEDVVCKVLGTQAGSRRVERYGSWPLALFPNPRLRCGARGGVCLPGTAPHDTRLGQAIHEVRRVKQGSDSLCRCRTQFVPDVAVPLDGVIAELTAKAPDHVRQQAPVAGDSHRILPAGKLVLCGCGDESSEQGVHAFLSFLAP